MHTYEISWKELLFDTKFAALFYKRIKFSMLCKLLFVWFFKFTTSRQQY